MASLVHQNQTYPLKNTSRGYALLLLQILQQRFNRRFQLLIRTFRRIIQRIVHNNIRYGRAQFLVFISSLGKPAAERQTHKGTINQTTPPGGNHRAIRCLPHQFADAQGFVGMRKNLGIGITAFITQRNRRFQIGRASCRERVCSTV